MTKALSQQKKQVSPWVGWSIVATIFLVQYGLLVSPSAFTHELASALNINTADVGYVLAAFLYTWVAMQIPAGLMFDHFNSKRLIFISTLILALGSVVLALAHNFFWGVVGRMLMGFGGSFSFVGALYLGRSWFAMATFPLIVGLTEAVSGVGEIGFGALFAGLKDTYSWRVILLCIAWVIVMLAIQVLFYVKDKYSEEVKERVRVWEDFKKTIASGRLWILALYTGFGFMHYMVMADMWGVRWLEWQYNINTLPATLLNSVCIVGFTVGCPVLSMLTKRFMIRRVILISAMLELMCMGFLDFMPMSEFMTWVFLFAVGFFTAAIILTFDLAELFVPKKSYGVAAGLINMFFGGLGIIGSPILSHMIQVCGIGASPEAWFLFSSGVAALILAVVINLKSGFHLKREHV